MADFKFSAAITIDIPDGYEVDAWDEHENQMRIASKLVSVSRDLVAELGTADFRLTSTRSVEASSGRPIVIVNTTTPTLLEMILESDHVEQPLAEPTA